MPDKAAGSQPSNAHIGRGLPRVLEFLIALVGLVILSPIIGLCCLATLITSRGPVLFRQKRVGLAGKTFQLFKLRTMRPSNGGPEVTAADDARVTIVGRFLRKAKLDELPQLWNVLKGQMSLVGPRPEVPRYVDQQNDSWRFILRAKPGIADPITVRLRNEEQLLIQLNGNREEFYLQKLQPYKLRAYEQYLRHRNWLTDIRVLSDTIFAVLFPARFPPPTLEEIAGVAFNQTAASDNGHLARSVESPAKTIASRIQSSRLLARQSQFALDVLALAGSFSLAYLLRFEFAIPPKELRAAIMQLPFAIVVQFTILGLTGVYSFIWRYIGMAEIRTFFKAAILAFVPLLVCRLALPDAGFTALKLPLSVIFIDTVFAFGSVLCLRVARRALHEAVVKARELSTGHAEPKKPVFLIGAGKAGMIAAREIINAGNSNLSIKGFVDDDPNKLGTVINSVRVLGSTEDLPWLVREYAIDHVVLAIPKATRSQFRRILDICEQIPVKVRVMPGLFEILQGTVKVSRIRDLQIEDLLGREQVQLDEQGIEKFMVGKTIMVTGAGGSIGSELSRQVARFQPANLLLVERAEFALFDINRELGATWPELSQVALVADINDRSRMRRIFAAYRPDIVLHAAAHKHVPMMEYNSTEAIKNNVLGTQLLGELAGQLGVEAFVLISTDKAVRPSSVMGASKRVAELVVQDLNRRFSTRYVAVRFGNVIGSAGSVIPIFRQQILDGGPVTVTHPDMTRYFMTIPEAAQLVLQAGSMGDGGEIFILDMGEPVRILDLAKDAITLSGLRPFEDIDVVFTGIRPGEKLFEELEIREEEMTNTRHRKIFIGKIKPYSHLAVNQALQRLGALAAIGDEHEIRTYLSELLPESQLETRNRSALANGANRELMRRIESRGAARRMGGTG
jgi:FlaA1/EpsC-like NDP-sugar epimerase/lipopolysaccharide/colanic/teichoic acid biosynthesis glycosyltransferase